MERVDVNVGAVKVSRPLLTTRVERRQTTEQRRFEYSHASRCFLLLAQVVAPPLLTACPGTGTDLHERAAAEPRNAMEVEAWQLTGAWNFAGFHVPTGAGPPSQRHP